MDATQIEGTAREIGGKVQEAAGDMTSTGETQLRGKAQQAAGQAQQVYDNVVDNIKTFSSKQPLVFLWGVIGIGFLTAIVFGRRK